MPINVDRRPYLLQPDRPREGAPRPLREGETETELSPAWRERAGQAGIVMKRPQWNPNTIPAHQVTLYAREKGLDGEFHHAAARALWETGANLGDLDVLKEIAEGCGLDWSELLPLLESEDSRSRVFQEHENARAQGVSGTPTYKVANELRFGDLSVEDLLELVQKAGKL